MFLSLVVDAFAVSGRERLKLNPADCILAIYRARNPHEWLPDSLELEALGLAIERRYGIYFGDAWSEQLTLGELFAAIHGCSHRPERR